MSSECNCQQVHLSFGNCSFASDAFDIFWPSGSFASQKILKSFQHPSRCENMSKSCMFRSTSIHVAQEQRAAPSLPLWVSRCRPGKTGPTSGLLGLLGLRCCLPTSWNSCLTHSMAISTAAMASSAQKTRSHPVWCALSSKTEWPRTSRASAILSAFSKTDPGTAVLALELRNLWATNQAHRATQPCLGLQYCPDFSNFWSHSGVHTWAAVKTSSTLKGH